LPQIRVIVADDHALFREALASLISSRPGFAVVGQATDGAEAVKRVQTERPDLVLMDISMPVMDGIEATRAVKASLPQTKVAMLTMLDGERDLLKALRAGADGYILKDCSPSELFGQMEAVVSGKASVSPTLAGQMLTKLANGNAVEPLSQREMTVLRLVAQGESNKAIARSLGITENTVKKHLSNLMDKLGMENRTQLAVYAMEQGLVDLP
jgi:DNA-binding NarL/FixJ family response regulator